MIMGYDNELNDSILQVHPAFQEFSQKGIAN